MRGVSGATVRAFGGRFAIALVLAVALTTAAVAGVNHEINTRVQKIRRINLLVAQPPPAGENFLIIGSDSRQFVDNPLDASAFGTDSGKNSDTLMVAHIEPSSQRTLVVSFPRDLMVNVSGLPGKNRINAAYGDGGPQAVIDTLKENFDIDVHHYVEVDFKSFQDVVDAIGNVRVYLPGRVRDLETGLFTPFGAGCYPLDGHSALEYVRSRTMEISDPKGPIVDPDTGEHWRLLDVRADLDRIPRQQQFIRKLAGLAIQKSLNDPFLAVEIADKVLGDIKADQSLSRDDVNALIRAFKTVDVNDPNSVDFETLPVAPDPNNPQVTLVPGPGANDLIDQLRTFGDNTPRQPAVVPSQVRVRVLDGSGTGAQDAVSTALVAQGFQSAGTGVDPRKHIHGTEIHYTPAEAPAAKELLTYVPDAALVPDWSLSNKVILVIGQTFTGLTTPPPTTVAPETSIPPPTSTSAAPTTTPTTTLPPNQQC